LKPDAKSQVTIEYLNGRPHHVDAVVVSTQHSMDVSLETIRKDMVNMVIREVIPSSLLDEKTKIFVNPTGRFVIGGPHGDTGLTGRKIIVDTYGGMGRHGGEHFPEKTAPKWIAPLLMPRGGLPKISLQPESPQGVNWLSPMLSEWLNPHISMLTCSIPERWIMKFWQKRSVTVLILLQRYHKYIEIAAANLCENICVRAFRP